MALTINKVTANGTEYSGVNAKKGNSIYAGNLSLCNNELDDLIAQKKGFAQKQAFKLIGDAWKKDTKAAQGITDMEQAISDKTERLNELRTKLKDIDKSKSAIQEEYGIDPESQEQKDLELLEKFQNYKGGSLDETFSKEEIERLRELQNIPRTEYQNKVLAQNASTGEIKLEIQRTEAQILGIRQSISWSKIEQLKSQDMLKASKAAGSIMDAADDEILGILVQDGVDKTDEKIKEEQEKVEEAKEKKEEQREKVDEEKETQEEQEELLRIAAEADEINMSISVKRQTTSGIEQAQKNIRKILQENNLIDEDLKGIKIDFNF